MRKTKSMSKHFLHMHELELNDKGENCKDNCIICKQPISESNFYHCNLCPEKIRIHEYSCSEIPLQLDHHPIHPLHTFFLSEKVRQTDFCHACGSNCYGGFAYKCVDRAFILDVNCALLTKNNNNKQQYHHQKKKIQFQFQQPQLPNHPHPLILCYKDKNLTYKCTCCSLTIDGDWLYVCLQCKGLLHHSCAELPLKIEHPLHSSHPLFLQSRSGFYDREFICSLCCQRRDGFAYHCHKCKFVVDVHCACLKPARQTQIQPFTHSHPLVLCRNKDNLPYTCYACSLPLEDSIYFCPECCVLLHKKCANLPQEIIKHLLHPQHTLSLHYHRHSHAYTRNLECGVCLNYCYGFYYECSHCQWYMDVRCAFLSKATIMRRTKFHRHPLVLISDVSHYKMTCSTCRKYSHFPLFRCVWCNVNHHVHCISALPPTLRYRNHVHTLAFTNHPRKDRPDDDDDSEFICDACEQRRDLVLPTYYCTDGCQYIAHPHCVVSEIIHILEEEWSKHENVEEPLALTLKEFLGSFTENENKEVHGLFESYKRDFQEGVVLPKIFLSLSEDVDEDKNKIRMAGTLMEKFVFEVEISRPWENWDSTSKIIKDGNYMIFKNQVSILKDLLFKDEDFSNRSRLSKKVNTLFIMMACEAIHSMRNTKVVDITTSLLLAWFHSFALAQYADFKIKFVIARLAKLVRAHFGLQADHDVPVDLNLAGLGVPIAKQLVVKDSKELTIIEKNGETDSTRKKVDKLQQIITKLDETIKELEKKKHAFEKKKHALDNKKQKNALVKKKQALEKKRQELLKTRRERYIIKECLSDALDLEGEMAGTHLL